MFDFLNTPLFWFLLGIFFMLIEISHFGFIFFFFGIGSFIVAILTWTGITHSLTLQMIIFICTSLLCLFLFRKKISSVFKGKISGKGQSVDDIKGEKAVVVSTIVPNGINGKVEYRGTIWQAQSDVQIEKDCVVEIVDRVNLTLKVKPNEKY